MLFKELLPQYKGNLGECEIENITDDSRKVTKGSVFVCICGPDNDGHNFAHKAVEAGATVVVCEKDLRTL